MSRPKLSSLSSLLPPKGEATRPETVAVPEAAMQAREQDSKLARTDRGYREGARSAVSFRMTERLQERLRDYAYRSRRTKQEILDEALHRFLQGEGF